ncbi:MAG: protease [Verrucomicrobiota bacterium]|nr:protease [Verrucomicrobiota bacterium]MDK2963319.1 protease [Verrucomicrobiota bacterium]
MARMKRRRKNRKYWGVILLLSLALAGTWLSRCRQVEADYPRDEDPKLKEVWSFGSGSVKVVRIPLEGVIMRPEGERLFSARSDRVENVLLQIRAAERDPEVRAVILEVNSPGGGVTPSDEIYNELSRFRKSRPDRRVVVFIRDLGASGAYYAAMAGDCILAEPTAVVGSIGVIMQSINIQGLSEKIGITDVTIKSGANKDLLNPFQPVNARQTALLQTLIDDLQARFSGLVADARNLDRAASPDLFDGRIFSAPQALDRGLIDRIGYWEDALSVTADLLGTDALRVVRYEAPKTFFESLMGAESPVILPQLKLSSPQFLYLWKP